MLHIQITLQEEAQESSGPQFSWNNLKTTPKKNSPVWKRHKIIMALTKAQSCPPKNYIPPSWPNAPALPHRGKSRQKRLNFHPKTATNLLTQCHPKIKCKKICKSQKVLKNKYHGCIFWAWKTCPNVRPQEIYPLVPDFGCPNYAPPGILLGWVFTKSVNAALTLY